MVIHRLDTGGPLGGDTDCVLLLCVPKIRFGVDGGKDGISSRPDGRSVQADSWRPGFALQVESKAGSRNPGSTATDQCTSPTGVETTSPQQYRSFSVCLALLLVSLRPWARLRLSGRRRSFAGTVPAFGRTTRRARIWRLPPPVRADETIFVNL